MTNLGGTVGTERRAALTQDMGVRGSLGTALPGNRAHPASSSEKALVPDYL